MGPEVSKLTMTGQKADESLKTKARGGWSSFLPKFADEYLNPFRARKRHIVRRQDKAEDIES